MQKFSTEFIKTFISIFFLIPLVIGALVFSKLLFQIIIILVAIGMLLEWYNMTQSSQNYLLLGLIIIPIPIASILLITMTAANYQYVLLTYFIIIWATDSAAMFGGKKFQGPKLAPKLSPNKTWSGLIIGVLTASILIRIATFIPGYDFVYQGFSLSVFAGLMGVIAQISDLFISFFKRRFHLKDTGNIIPGHGGILDRCDAGILTAPILLYIIL